MRVLVISDVHSNLAALQAVLENAGEFDALWSLGDVVGYGPQPNECIATLREYDHLYIAGNHDWGVLGRISLDDFNRDARRANLWNREQLTPESLAYLEAAPETIVKGDITLAHGSPRYPVWEYLVYASAAKLSYEFFETKLCLVGHTHVPALFEMAPQDSDCRRFALPIGEPFALEEGRYIVNPGSVGQPRDGDPRAAYLLLDTDDLTIDHRRVPYDIAATQELMRQAGLPRRHIARLEMGW
ncbi:MAG: metallophosphoesterase family protein [Anaerolineae bacterium]